MGSSQPKAYASAPAAAPRGVVGGAMSAVPPDDGEGPVVVFLIGMRFNRLRKVRSWWPVFVGMPRMLAELDADPELGLLGARTWWSGRDLLVVQYWRSAEHLGRFAKDPGLTHRPAWARFNAAAAGTADVGIWHETYQVRAGDVETVYGNMPPTGLGKARGLAPVADVRRGTVHERMDRTLSA